MKLFVQNLIFTLIFFTMISCSNQSSNKKSPPEAEKIKKELTIHDHTRVDPYYWLNQRDNPDVIRYIEKENDYLQKGLEDTESLQQELFNEMKSRIKEDENSAPFLKNGYYYYTRYEEGEEYPFYCRKKGDLMANEEIILDVPEMARNYSYYRIGSYDVSPDNRKVVFAVDTMGRRQHTLLIKDLETSEIYPTDIEFGAGDVVWANDNKTFFYTVIDPVTLRYIKVMKYNTDNKETTEMYHEEDETFYYMGVSKTKDGKYIKISVRSTLSNEELILDANTPEGNFRVFQPRQKDLLYETWHHSDKFYILTNHKAQNFRLMETTDGNTQMQNWQEVIAHREDVLVENMEVFNNFMVIQERKNGLRQMRIINLQNNSEHYLDFEEEAYTAGIQINEVMNSNLFRLSYTSLTTPYEIIDYNMDTKEQTIVWQQTVLGDFDKNDYQTYRILAPARDGVEIPVTLVYKKGTDPKGQNPLLQYGYGSYGISMNPRFNSNLISLLDRGFVYAMAHVRGGEDMGRQWYEDGKLLNKMNTFYDFIDVSEFLIENNYTQKEKLFAMGGSAGGLLMGAVANMRPDLYKGIVASVPFVDVVTTMLDTSIPLTTSEYDEWGNPNDPVYYHYMLSYSPYDRVQEQDYPNMLILSGLYDSQVQYWEPTKWTAKLRDHNTADTDIFLYTYMEAGHGGSSGRFQKLKEIALQYAFLLHY
ncbi:MAG: S9 family peptidase [Bacteroidales bacterium]